MKHTLAFALVLVCSLLAAETWIYEKTVVELPMGEGEGQLSLRRWDDMHEGPTSFTVDEDENIYVLTRHKNIIKKFDRNGNYLCSSKYEEGAGDVIRFLGYHDGMIYTMSGDLRIPCIRRYTESLELQDYHLIADKNNNTFYGLSFIESNSGRFGLLRNSDPRVIIASELVLLNNQYQFAPMDLFGNSYKPIDLRSVWPSDIGYRFINYDTYQNLYIEKYVAPLTATELGIVNEKGDFISTNIVFDSHIVYDIQFMDRVYPIVLKSGIVYNLLITEDNIELIRWHKTGAEK